MAVLLKFEDYEEYEEYEAVDSQNWQMKMDDVDELMETSRDPFLGVKASFLLNEEDDDNDDDESNQLLDPSMESAYDLNDIYEVMKISPVEIPPTEEFESKVEHKGGVFCPKCSKQLSQKSTLRKHLRIHNNERPHKCLKCNYKATQRQNLTRHILTVHKSGPYKFECNELTCGFKTNRADKLKEHQRRKHRK